MLRLDTDDLDCVILYPFSSDWVKILPAVMEVIRTVDVIMLVVSAKKMIDRYKIHLEFLYSFYLIVPVSDITLSLTSHRIIPCPGLLLIFLSHYISAQSAHL